MNKKPTVAVVMPAYNAARTLTKIYRSISKKLADHIIICDDGSKDETTKVAKKIGLKPITHSKNLGYGANQKTLYKKALDLKADYIIMLHPDGQYDPEDLSKFINALNNNQADLILGSRFLDRGDKETPFYKAFFIRIITTLFNLVLGTKLTEANTGYRAYTRKLLQTIPFEKNGAGYIFDPQLIIQTVKFGFKVAEVPVSKAYNPERIEPNLSASILHGFENLFLLTQFLLQRFKVIKADFLIK